MLSPSKHSSRAWCIEHRHKHVISRKCLQDPRMKIHEFSRSKSAHRAYQLWAPPHELWGNRSEGAGTRTLDHSIKSRMLYQLSYALIVLTFANTVTEKKNSNTTRLLRKKAISWFDIQSRIILKFGQAERTGFEPAEGFDPFTDLANRRFRPLSHRSVKNSMVTIQPSHPFVSQIEID